jgi:hypothetical protein
MDLNTTKDINVLISSSDQKQASNEMKSKRRAEALGMVDPNTINPQWRNEQILRSVGEFEDEEIAQAQDVQTYNDRKSLSKASEAINTILLGKEPLLWYGATAAFMQKIHDFASDKQSTLGDKFEKLINYSMAHAEIVKQNVDRKVAEQSVLASQAGLQASQGQPGPAQSEAANPGMSGGMSRAMNVATASM